MKTDNTNTSAVQNTQGLQKTPGSLVIGVAFVWFTTHFGGGFASGAQLYSYFVRYGKWSLFLPAFSMAYNALFFWYCLRYARKHELYDYRSYNNRFYGRFAPIFSNLFELLYIAVMCVAPAVAFATGGATLSAVTGLPYLLCTLIIGAFIFVVAIFGTDLVRNVSSVLSILIVAGLLVVYIPNILSGSEGIRQSIALMESESAPFKSALWSAFLYGTFQLCNVAVFVQHSKTFSRPQDVKKSMLAGWALNSVLMITVVLGLLVVYANPEMAGQSVPTLFMVQQGVGAKVFTPIISVLIILGAVSTAVNMVAAMVKRVGSAIETPEEREKTELGKPILKTVVIALICCLADFSIAQFGLLTLIAKAYSFLAYLAIPVILIPYVIHMIVTRFDTK